MSDLKETSTEYLSPFRDKENLSIILNSDIKDNSYAVNSFDEMYQIPFNDRKLGMICVVKGDKFAYRLINNANSDTTCAWDWDALKIKTEETKKSIKPTFDKTSAKLDQKIYDRYLIFDLINTEALGPNENKILIPYDSSLVEITLNISTEIVLSGEIQVSIEFLDNIDKKWKQIDSITLTENDNTNSIIKTLESEIPIPKGSEIRCNILKTQENVKIMNILVHVKTLD